MGTFLVRGGRKIEGEFAVRGSKNAALPILAACLLAEDEVVLENIPLIRDVLQTLDILRELGCKISLSEETRTVAIDSRRQRDRAEDALLHPFSGGAAGAGETGKAGLSWGLCHWQASH